MANVAAEELCELVKVLGPEEALGALKVRELRNHCKRFGLKSAGVKLDMVQQLGAYVMKAGPKGSGVKTDGGPLGVAAARAASSVRSRVDKWSDETDLETVSVTPQAKGCASRAAIPSFLKTDCVSIANCSTAIPTIDVEEIALAAPTALASDLESAISLGPDETHRMLQVLTVNHLREHCRSLGAADIGKKADLVRRLGERVKVQLTKKMHEAGIQSTPKDSMGVTQAVPKSLGGNESVSKEESVCQQYSKTKMWELAHDAGQGFKRNLECDSASFHEPQSAVKRACVSVAEEVVSGNQIESRAEGITPDESHKTNESSVLQDSCMERQPDVEDKYTCSANEHVTVEEHSAIPNESEQHQTLSGDALIEALIGGALAEQALPREPVEGEESHSKQEASGLKKEILEEGSDRVDNSIGPGCGGATAEGAAAIREHSTWVDEVSAQRHVEAEDAHNLGRLDSMGKSMVCAVELSTSEQVETAMDPCVEEHDGIVPETLSTNQPHKVEEPIKEDELGTVKDDGALTDNEESIATFVDTIQIS